MTNPGDEKTTSDGKTYRAEKEINGCEGCSIVCLTSECKELPCTPGETGGAWLIWKEVDETYS